MKSRGREGLRETYWLKSNWRKSLEREVFTEKSWQSWRKVWQKRHGRNAWTEQLQSWEKRLTEESWPNRLAAFPANTYSVIRVHDTPYLRGRGSHIVLLLHVFFVYFLWNCFVHSNSFFSIWVAYETRLTANGIPPEPDSSLQSILEDSLHSPPSFLCCQITPNTPCCARTS